MTLDRSLRELATVTHHLATAGCVAAEDEARELCACAPNETTLARWVRRRITGEPTAWIVGWAPFGGLRLQIDPGVYVPRAQSEELVERAATHLPGRGAAADLGTGCGAVAARLRQMRPRSRIVATDDDARAVTCARRNGVAVVHADLGTPLASHRFDVVTAIAPYVPTDQMPYLPRDVTAFEPAHALDGGDGHGVDVLRRVIADAARILVPGGWLITEVGADQVESLQNDLAEHGFGGPTTWRDDDGDVRGFEARWTS